MSINSTTLIKDLELLRKNIDEEYYTYDEISDELKVIIDELKISKRSRKNG